MKKNLRRKAFTLIELLVVITIIAILAGLAVPGINSAMKKARQTAQVSDARNVGTIMFTYATDHDGLYNNSEDTDPVAIFQRLKDEGYLTDLSIAYTPVPGKSKWDGSGFSDSNVGYGMAIGATDSSNDLLPLVFHQNTAVEGAVPGDEVTAAVPLPLGDDGVWKQEGLVVMFKGNNAEFIKADKNNSIILYKPGFDGAGEELKNPAGGGS